MSLYAENRDKVITTLLASLDGTKNKGVILLQGGAQETRYDTDHEPVFRQESYFHYLFGTNLPDCYGALSFDGDYYKSVLFVPTWDEEVATVCGDSPDFMDVACELGVDEVMSVESLKNWVEQEMTKLGWRSDEANGIAGDHAIGEHPQLYLLKGLNTDSGNYAKPAHYKGIEKVEHLKNEDILFRCIAECRVHKVRWIQCIFYSNRNFANNEFSHTSKTPSEISLMRYTNYISSMGHVNAMRKAHPGMMEYQLESMFMHHTYYYGGCRFMSYTCICACGPNGKLE